MLCGIIFTYIQKEVVKMAELFDSFLQFDLGVFQWIQGIQNDFLDMLMVGITTLGNSRVRSFVYKKIPQGRLCGYCCFTRYAYLQ